MSKTWKNILTILLYTLLAAAAVAYFYFAVILYRKNQPQKVCKSVKVTLLDSSLNKFVTKQEIIDLIDNFCGKTVGKKMDSIKLSQIESLLNHRSVVKEAQAYVTRDGVLNIDIRQRKPVIRIQSSQGGFYIDETEYIFPLIPNYSSYVPIVTGNIPEEVFADDTPAQGKDSLNWLGKILNLGLYLEKHPFWNAQIEEIYINDENDIELITRVGDQKIIFGSLEDIEEKFEKLYSYYKYIIPNTGWDKYAVVNLKYRGQIVCTKAGAAYQKRKEEKMKAEEERRKSEEEEIRKEAEEIRLAEERERQNTKNQQTPTQEEAETTQN